MKNKKDIFSLSLKPQRREYLNLNETIDRPVTTRSARWDMVNRHNIRIKAEPSRYHRFALYFDFSNEILTLCRAIREKYGWKQFSFDSSEDKKRWVFSDPSIVTMFHRMFPETQIDPEVLIECKKKFDPTKRYGTQVTATTTTQQSFADRVKSKIKEKKRTNFKPNGIKGEMYEYQKVGVEFLIASGGRAIVADPPGLGKTLQALGFITHTKAERSLIVAPASVKSSWEKEVKKWTNLSYVVIDGKTDVSQIPSNVNIWIINYDILMKHLDQLTKVRFDVLVADECHYVKNHLAQRTKALRLIAKNIKNIILLSGTPLLSRPVEMFTLLNMIDPVTWNNWYKFTIRYCNGHRNRWGYDASGVSNAKELHEKIQSYFIRRRKEDVLTQLPPKIHIDTPVDLSPSYKREYDKIESDFISYLESQKEDKTTAEIRRIIQSEKLTRLNYLRQTAAMGKVDAAVEIIKTVIESEEKILVFSSFIEPLRAIEKKFKGQCVMLTGTTKVSERGEIVDRFQNDKNTKIFLGGIKSAGVGITLTAASNVLFLDYSWNPADHQQAEDRIHRPGQEARSVNIYQLFAKGTIDEKMKSILKRKSHVFQNVIEGEIIKKEKETMELVINEIRKKYQKKN